MKKSTMLVAVIVVLLVPMISIASISITYTPRTAAFQQTVNNPCVIGDTSCKEPTTVPVTYQQPSGANAGAMIYSGYSGTPGGNNGSSYDIYSPQPNNVGGTTIPLNYNTSSATNGYSGTAYTVGFIESLMGGNTFSVGIDDNSSSVIELLNAFNVYINGSLISSLSFQPSPAATISNVNGNGYSDAVLNGFDLTGISTSATIVFEAKVSSDTDGMEEFFLIKSGTPTTTAPPAVPEPASVVFLGTGLLGTALVFRRKWSRNHSA